VIVVDNRTVVYSASDLTSAASCEWALMHKLDARLGRVDAVVETDDDMMNRAARLGDVHELAVLEKLKREFRVVEIERPEGFEGVAAAASASTEAFRSGADVVYQAAFFDGRFLGYADFIQRSGTTADGQPIYDVFDSKLARSAKITALLQLAAYSEQLEKLGIETGENVHLILGNGSTSSHALGGIAPVYRKRRARLQAIIDGRIIDPAPAEWGDERYAACGHCDACSEQIVLSRDVLLVAGLRLTQGARLRAAGVTTINDLAARTDHVDSMTDATLGSLRTQAAVQLESTAERLAWRTADASAFAALPHPDDGDIFFDFEGDPLYSDGHGEWGLDYLFGLVDAAGEFTAFWAHDLVQERQALIDFLDFVERRRHSHPGMHIYHYASYERTHLLTLAARHGYGEEAVAGLLRDHVLVDLYPIVRRGLVIGNASYSLKKLEPLYMSVKRSGTDNAADSVTEYARFTELASAGRQFADEAATILRDIAEYNAYDCRSTLALRDWLLERAEENSVPLAHRAELEIETTQREPDQLTLALEALVDATPRAVRSAEDTAIALAAAAMDYHRRENNSFWWEHYDRLRQPTEEWSDSRDVIMIESVEVLRNWSIEPRAKAPSRTLAVRGAVAPGSSISVGSAPFLVYDEPFPPNNDNIEPGARFAHDHTVVESVDNGTYTIRERRKIGEALHDEVPIAVAPSKPPHAGVLIESIHEWGERVLSSWPTLLPDAALDVLARRDPRETIHINASDTVAAIRDTVLDLDHSYLAVQGPPGTGKTFTGSRVIARLVNENGWKVGVVAQSHAAVENMLTAVIDAGLDPALVGKKPRSSNALPGPWTELTDTTQSRFTARDSFVLGGTAWTFANRARIPLGSLDVLVIEEAGQFSLANTIAASGAAQRILLLGDPQQLPQVSQGRHPEPVDGSALGWLAAGHDVLPPERGFFLDTTWRMHPALCAPVSRLSYEGKLTAHASDRQLHGIQPGLHPVAVNHRDRSTSSPEEADAVLAIVRDLVGRAWSAGGATAPLAASDIIVVAPYNAHVELLRTTLDARGFAGVRVGTVDRFQGQEAAVAIVSLAASSAVDVPRGIEFLLLANRLNVAISRAQWAAYLVYSPELTDFLPHSVEQLAELSAFIDLVEPRGERGGSE
jgi:predicted RecB family nuclease